MTEGAGRSTVRAPVPRPNARHDGRSTALQGTLTPSAELGGRYRIVCRVGAGGIDVCALDLKLRWRWRSRH
jgi:hypothetical protein